MKKLIKSVFVYSPEEMSLEDNHVIVTVDGKLLGRGPLRNIEVICYYGYKPIRPALMEACIKHGVRLNVLHPDGQFISAVTGSTYESSNTRRLQYKAASDSSVCLEIAKNLIMAKAFNTRWLFGLMYRDYESQIDRKTAQSRADTFKKIVGDALAAKDMDALREIRKNTEKELYSSFDDLIMIQKDTFKFEGRSAKPPTDKVNTLLSFAYELLEELCTSALETAGLDSFSGFFTKEKQGRPALTFDLMEEFRACIADKYVLNMINKGIVDADSFEEVAENDFILTESGSEAAWEYWLESLTAQTMHPYLEEQVEWGLVPYASALLLARFLREEIDKYPPFLRKKP